MFEKSLFKGFYLTGAVRSFNNGRPGNHRCGRLAEKTDAIAFVSYNFRWNRFKSEQRIPFSVSSTMPRFLIPSCRVNEIAFKTFDSIRLREICPTIQRFFDDESFFSFYHLDVGQSGRLI